MPVMPVMPEIQEYRTKLESYDIDQFGSSILSSVLKDWKRLSYTDTYLISEIKNLLCSTGLDELFDVCNFDYSSCTLVRSNDAPDSQFCFNLLKFSLNDAFRDYHRIRFMDKNNNTLSVLSFQVKVNYITLNTYRVYDNKRLFGRKKDIDKTINLTDIDFSTEIYLSNVLSDVGIITDIDVITLLRILKIFHRCRNASITLSTLWYRTDHSMVKMLDIYEKLLGIQ